MSWKKSFTDRSSVLYILHHKLTGHCDFQFWARPGASLKSLSVSKWMVLSLEYWRLVSKIKRHKWTSCNTCENSLRLHLQSDLNQVYRRPNAHWHQSRQHTGHSQVQHATGMPYVTIAILAYESLCITEEAKHGWVVKSNAGQWKWHALKKPWDLRKKTQGYNYRLNTKWD